ncbi:chaperone modulator CbpM [Methyloversatilis sp.]|uniref:chaperone modulator CbpM n=1 Tax=Methyloversatilis sp. TaxID=2569862 RepID=UPI002736BCF4|nr:chaperone modulator CbpM [Methyloversatilis sp.]MDP2867551.1 chaperone modulator CbpM [Methyloversatilis sp.]MDP3288376.1 chaperone modulator CbpM [Methyloversatilis sp.]MDP3453935.1 chaperone modulator CbpM [Methyloversatilis sp.]MDP3578089.1 chaperone modulator CbpM [Methyloversatilis sp.]
MTHDDILTGELLDDARLTLDELALACAIEPGWIIERVEAGYLCCMGVGQPQAWRFASAELVRARQLRAMERDFDANPELAALVVDLIEEVRGLRQQLSRMRR